MQFAKPYKLTCGVQNYSWGRNSKDSIIPTFAKVNDEKPLAELWIGAHPKLSSKLEDEDLEQLISKYPLEILGERALSQYGPELPFLFKVLSIDKPLSIQAHPDKARAIILNQKDPLNYPDQNHKPEMAIALSELDLLWGFRTDEEIGNFFQTVPELTELLGEYRGLRETYQSLFFVDEKRANKLSILLCERLKKKKDLSDEESWIIKLGKQYPSGDVGLFSFYLLNLLKLQPGEALFTGANIIHAYLSGELIECMANSDNVVRAGLTEKFKDVKTLSEMLDYTIGKPSLLEGRAEFTDILKAYRPPASEFYLKKIEGSSNFFDYNSGDSVEILLCLDGKIELHSKSNNYHFQKGDVVLLPAVFRDFQLSLENALVFSAGIPS